MSDDRPGYSHRLDADARFGPNESWRRRLKLLVNTVIYSTQKAKWPMSALFVSRPCRPVSTRPAMSPGW
jgi:hypothetical protein